MWPVSGKTGIWIPATNTPLHLFWGWTVVHTSPPMSRPIFSYPIWAPVPIFFFFLPCSICCQAYSVKGFQIRVLRWSLSDSLVSTLTSSRNSSWEVLVAIAKKNSFPPSSTGWFPNLSYGFGSVNSVNLRAKTQFRVTNEGYSVAAGAKLCCSYPSGFSASREATGIYLYISPPNLRQTAHTKVSGIIQSRSWNPYVRVPRKEKSLSFEVRQTHSLSRTTFLVPVLT